VSWVPVSEHVRIEGDGIMGVKPTEDGAEIRYIDGSTRVVKGVTVQQILAKVTLMKKAES